MIKTIAKQVVRRLGYEIQKRSPGETWAYGSTAARECIELISNNTMVSGACLDSLFQQALFCERHGISGSFVECGVWNGGCCGLMALANLKYGASPRHIHLFDAFQDICEPDAAVDGERAVREATEWSREPGASGQLRPLTGFYDRHGGPGALDKNKQLLEGKIGYPSEFLHYHVGWFQDTLPRESGTIETIAILRLDADWYASTKICLAYLCDRVVSGGFVIIDDYGAYEGCRKAVDEYLASLPYPVFLSYVNKDCRYWIKP